MVLLNQVFPCFHCFSKTTPTHICKLFHKLLFRGRGECNVNQLSHVPVVYCGIFVIKKHPNLEKRVFNFQQTVCYEFSDMSNLMAKGIKYLKY